MEDWLTPVIDSPRRREFAAFLDRLVAAKGRVDGLDWGRHAIAHYRDDKVEAIRRMIVRLAQSCAGDEWPEFHREVATLWAQELRDSA